MRGESCGVIGLEKNRLNAFRTRSNERIRCLEGVIWLTQDGVARDFILEAGESLDLGPGADVTVSALTPSRYQVTPPLPTRQPEGRFSRMARDVEMALRSLA